MQAKLNLLRGIVLFIGSMVACRFCPFFTERTWFLTFLGGIFMNTMINWAFDLTFWLLLGYDYLTEGDVVFHPQCYDPDHPPHVVGVFVCEKFKFEEMRDILLDGHRNSVTRMSGVIVDFFGRTYYKRLSDKLWKMVQGDLV